MKKNVCEHVIALYHYGYGYGYGMHTYLIPTSKLNRTYIHILCFVCVENEFSVYLWNTSNVNVNMTGQTSSAPHRVLTLQLYR